jgi:hypothetical protein
MFEVSASGTFRIIHARMGQCRADHLARILERFPSADCCPHDGTPYRHPRRSAR